MAGARIKKWGVLLTSGLLSMAVAELVLRMIVTSSERSYGTFLGYELPPVQVIPCEVPEPESSDDSFHGDLVVGGKRISSGDLWGFHRDDPQLGYAPRENATSLNGWWQSNSIGAREREETSPEVPEGHKRLLVFGDSYAQGSRVAQEEAWPQLLEASVENLDVVNLGADGYSMGQSFLRYRRLQERLEFDFVMLVFVPIRDLWRDINVIRTLGEPWDLYTVLPRFVVEGQGELRLIPAFYDEPSAVFAANAKQLSPELRSHLQRYDRFYFEAEQGAPVVIGRLVLYKVAAAAHFELKRRRLRDSRLEPDSEGVRVTRAIFRAMHREVRRRGKEFVLVFLPSDRDLTRLARSASYRRNWREMVAATCNEELRCIDLSEPFRALPSGALDRGYDGTHYGPRANRKISELVTEGLFRMGIP